MTERLFGRHYATGEPVELRVEDERITSIDRLEGIAAEQVGSLWLAPTLVDLQVNGFGGWDLNSAETSSAHLLGTTRALWSAGVAHYCP
ncbi:MAG TPA: N-acetylglucosamine-6-phosphate deacetylase, partial [Chloroflexota bacterium]|nr:N-acetylglucosamine-6-phosphate deacetylase [Chloroflexota bacterium]